MTHTPGPWKVRGSNNMVCGPEKNTIADVRYKNGSNDVHLIAAAPDLLDALQRVLTLFSVMAEQTDMTQRASYQDRLADALAAIAKAKGKAQ